MPSPGQETLTGSVERVTFHAEDTGYAILKVRIPNRSEPATILGNTPAVNAGENIVALGSWVDVADYGRQFKASRIDTAPPSSREGIERFLGSGLIHGIGPVYAKKLVEKFGEQVFEIIANASKRLEDVEGIGRKRRLEIKASWEKQKAIRDIMVFLYEHGVGTARALRIYKAYGDRAVAVLRENPYQLTKDIHGVGFKTADDVARKLGIAADAPQRIVAGIFHLLNAAADQGHCALPAPELLEKASQLLGAPKEQVRTSLDTLVAAGELARETQIDVGNLNSELENQKSEIKNLRSEVIYLPRLLRAEAEVADRIRRLAGAPPAYPPIDIPAALAWCGRKTGITLAGAQATAVTEALRHRVLIITGGPGVGKTTILKSILLILSAKKVDAVLCAPTGRAAKRLAASAGIPASTIHRLLEYQPATGFGRDAGNPLKGDLFVMDESSMTDLPLMHAFLRALPDTAHLLLVGDVDQLPSVGPGSVLRDLIDSGVVRTVRLTQIFRQSVDSRIVEIAHAINHGHMPDLSSPRKLEPENLDVSPALPRWPRCRGTWLTRRDNVPLTRKLETSPSDFYFIERDTPERIAETIARLVRDRLPGRFGFDPFHDIQVLTPMHRNSLGTTALNRLLQAALNPENEIKLEIDRFGTTFRAGDKVIQVRNDYEKNAFNGDIGVITRIDTDPVSVHVRFDETRAADYEPGELDELQLAYAITIHKSQGSEFPAVIIPVSSQHYIMLQRNLIYTGVTRGKRLVILVGDKKALGIAVRNAQTRQRCSLLRERLRM